METQDAQASLAAIARSQDKVRSSTGRLPLWYLAGIAALLFLVAAVGDLALSKPLDILLSSVIPLIGLVLLLILGIRSSRVRLHRSQYRGSYGKMLLIGGGIGVLALVAIALGTNVLEDSVLRPAGFPFPGTVSGLILAIGFLVITLIGNHFLGRNSSDGPA